MTLCGLKQIGRIIRNVVAIFRRRIMEEVKIRYNLIKKEGGRLEETPYLLPSLILNN